MRAVLTLLSGGVIAQILPWLATFALARLYAPSEFGYLALFTSITAAAAIAATGRYELAITLPKAERDANSLALLAALISLCVSALSALVLLCLPADFLGMDHWHGAQYALPLAILAMALYQISSYRFLRQGLYRSISAVRLVQAGVTVILSLLAGWAGYQSGLIIGYVCGWLTGALLSVLLLHRSLRINLLQAVAGMKKNALEFYHHALYGTLPALLDSLSIFSIIFIITHHYGSDYAGQYNLSRLIAFAPVSLVAGAIGQVLLRESSQQLRMEQDDRPLFRKVSTYLFCAALLYVPLLMMTSPHLFPLFFGSSWQTAGILTAILALSYGIRLLVSTLSSFLLAHRALRINGAWQGAYFVIINCLYFFHPQQPMSFFWALTAIDLLLFAVYFVLIRQVVMKLDFRQKRSAVTCPRP